jgi:VWFA-related protein
MRWCESLQSGDTSCVARLWTSRRAFVVPAAVVLLLGGAAAQERREPPPLRDSSVFRVGVDLVQIDATVTDQRGRHVIDLTSDDFEVLQDNRPQRLSTFAFITAGAGSPVPGDAAPATGPILRPLSAAQVRRTIAIVVDDLGLSIESAARVRGALRRFVDEKMQPGDLVAILRTGAGIGALQQFTTERRALHAAAERVRYNFRTRAAAFALPGTEEKLFLDEVFTAGTLGAIHYVIRGVRELPGRKSIVVLSDGFGLKDGDRRYGHILGRVREVVEAANRAGVVIHTLHAAGLAAEGYSASGQGGGFQPSRQNTRAMQDGLGVLADDTGGIFIRDTNDLSGGLGRVLDESQSYYLLGYVPDRATFAAATPQFHALTVRVKRAGLRVRSRRGFLARSDTAQAPADPLMNAVTSPFAGGDIRMRLSSFFGLAEKTGPVLQSFMHLDARDLMFDEQPDGTRTAQIETLAVTFGENGERADQDARRYTVTLARDRYQQALERGFVYMVRVPVKRPGAYQLRIALRDAKGGKIGSASSFVEVPDVSNGRLTLSGLLIQGLPRSTGAANAAVQEIDPNETVAMRNFRQGTMASYVCYVYNARHGRAGQPQVESEIRLYRESVEVFRTEPRAVPFSSAAPGELMAAGVLQLGSATPPGSYLLEIIVTDKLAKKGARATQTVDFEIVE